MLYIGPESVAPVLSALAAIIGFVVMFWRRVVFTFRRFVAFFRFRTTK